MSIYFKRNVPAKVYVHTSICNLCVCVCAVLLSQDTCLKDLCQISPHSPSTEFPAGSFSAPLVSSVCLGSPLHTHLSDIVVICNETLLWSCSLWGFGEKLGVNEATFGFFCLFTVLVSCNPSVNCLPLDFCKTEA